MQAPALGQICRSAVATKPRRSALRPFFHAQQIRDLRGDPSQQRTWKFLADAACPARLVCVPPDLTDPDTTSPTGRVHPEVQVGGLRSPLTRKQVPIITDPRASETADRESSGIELWSPQPRKCRAKNR